jgi:mono/diheme cytochrome c family protein
MRRLVLLGLALAILALAGCGGDNGGGGGGGGGNTDTGGAATPTETATQSGGGGASGSTAKGKELFAGTCGQCHTLKDAGTTGTFGPNLDELKPDKATVLHAIETGPGAMPDHLFTGADAEEIATYVSSVAGK